MALSDFLQPQQVAQAQQQTQAPVQAPAPQQGQAVNREQAASRWKQELDSIRQDPEKLMLLFQVGQGLVNPGAGANAGQQLSQGLGRGFQYLAQLQAQRQKQATAQQAQELRERQLAQQAELAREREAGTQKRFEAQQSQQSQRDKLEMQQFQRRLEATNQLTAAKAFADMMQAEEEAASLTGRAPNYIAVRQRFDESYGNLSGVEGKTLTPKELFARQFYMLNPTAETSDMEEQWNLVMKGGADGDDDGDGGEAETLPLAEQAQRELEQQQQAQTQVRAQDEAEESQEKISQQISSMAEDPRLTDISPENARFWMERLDAWEPRMTAEDRAKAIVVYRKLLEASRK